MEASEAKRSESVLIQIPLDAPQMLLRFSLPCGSERSEAERVRSNLDTPRCLPDVFQILPKLPKPHQMHIFRHRCTSDFHFDADASEAKRSEAVLV